VGWRAAVLVCVVLSGCGGGSSSQDGVPDALPGLPDAARPDAAPPDAPPPDAPPPDAGLPDAAPITHRIATRAGAGERPELYDRTTGERFVPRGANYVRLAPHLPDYPSPYHSTLDVGGYDAERAGRALGDMRALGYNAVRIFLNPQSSGVAELDRPAISRAYVANLADFLGRARDLGIQVVITAEHIAGGYGTLLTVDGSFGGFNLYFLSPSAVTAQRAFWRDLARALVEARAPLDALLAYELFNEVFFETDLAPVARSSGTIETANGASYDLGDATARSRSPRTRPRS
jgi:hypothetical protein